MMASEAGEVKGIGAGQALKKTCTPLTVPGKQTERADCEDERADTAAVFLGRAQGPYVLSR